MRQEASTHASVAANDVTLLGARGPLFDPVSFRLGRGESLCLMGPNGVGKCSGSRMETTRTREQTIEVPTLSANRKPPRAHIICEWGSANPA